MQRSLYLSYNKKRGRRPLRLAVARERPGQVPETAGRTGEAPPCGRKAEICDWIIIHSTKGRAEQGIREESEEPRQQWGDLFVYVLKNIARVGATNTVFWVFSSLSSLIPETVDGR